MSLRLRASLAPFPSALYNRGTGTSLVASTAQSESSPAATCWNGSVSRSVEVTGPVTLELGCAQ